MNLRKYQFAIFDYDGVILDSNQIKTESFRESLREYGNDEVSKFIDYHISNGGVSRYDKFKYFFEDILKIKEYESEYNLALAHFSSFNKKNLKEAKIVEGLTEVLEIFKSLDLNLYVVSGSDKEELNSLLNQKKVSKYFTEILGSPTRKESHCSRIYKSENYGPSLYFGDSRLDFICAEAIKSDFIFVEKYSDWRDIKIIEERRFFSKISTFDNLLSILK